MRSLAPVERIGRCYTPGQNVQAGRWKEIVRPYYLRWFHFPSRGGRPAYFDAPWRYPEVPLAGIATPGKPSFLFLPMSDWHTRIQRPQHLAAALATTGHGCYFLNPHLGRQFVHPYVFDRNMRTVRLADRIAELHVRLPSEPVYHHRLLTAKENDTLAAALSRVYADSGTALVQILSFPAWGEVALRLRERHGWPIIYDCHDLLSGFHNVDRAIANAETGLLERADYVVFSSLWLQERHAAAVRHSAILRNAVPRSFLDAAAGAQGTPRTAKTAGYFGALDRWFDIEAVRRSAELHPDVRFRLIGRMEFEPIQSLDLLPNVEFTGEVPHRDLPAALADFDVGLIPFLVNDLTRAANPIKLYEYFSTGIPVVSTRLPEVEQYGNLTYLAETPNDFATCVASALEESDPALRRDRIATANTETWGARAEQLASVALRLLST